MDRQLNKEYEKTVSVIIPAFNEENRIKETIKAVQSLEMVSEIIVVDDGSHDKTSTVASNCGAYVLKNKKNYGKGKALQNGLKKAKGYITVFLDADLGSTAAEAKKLIQPVIDGICDMTIAKFGKPSIKGGFGIVKKISRLAVKLITGIEIHSVLSGQRAFKTEIIKNINISNGYGAEIGLTIDILKKGYSVMEIQVNMKHNETGRNLKGFIHRGKQLFHIVMVIIKKFGRREIK